MKSVNSFIMTACIAVAVAAVMFCTKPEPEPDINTALGLPADTPRIAVTQDIICLDNQAIALTEDARNIPQEEPDPIIERLYEKLRVCMAMEEDMARIGALNAVQGKVILQIDKNIDFDVLFKIMNTCGKAGYHDMALAVISDDDGKFAAINFRLPWARGSGNMGILGIVSGQIKGKSVAAADIFGKGGFATDIDAILSGVGGLK